MRLKNAMAKKIFLKGSFLGFRATLFIILSLVLIFFDYRFNLFAPAKNGLSLFLTPIQYVANLPTTLVDIAEIDFATKKALIAENTALKDQQLLLQAKIQKQAFLEEENQKLRTLLGSAQQIKDKVLIAELLAVDFNNLNRQIIVNKGKNDGVYVGQPVLDAYGFMGQVISVDNMTSRVLLITDTQSAIPVLNVRNGMRSVAIGVDSPNTLELSYVPETSDVKVGDLLVTSNLGLRLPEGYPIGVISSVRNIVGERFAKVIVTPSSHVDSSRYVLMVWPGEINKPAKTAPKPKQKAKTKAKNKGK